MEAMSLSIEIVYVFPTILGNGYTAHAERFLASYLEHPPMVAHRSTIVCNGAAPTLEQRALFSILPEVKFLVGSDAGYDISAYQEASAQSTADMIVFFGGTAYVRVDGWLLLMARAMERHGVAQYGCMANRGDPAQPRSWTGGIYPHLRTTGIWCSPKLFNEYPHKVTTPGGRYPFEHGPNAFSEWVRRRGLKNWLVLTSGEYLWEQWDSAPEGFHRGGQRDMLTGDHLSCPPHYACE
jgi:hypothetical protein